MINRGQVFVRALDSNGNIFNCDALDLDEESFRRVVLDKLCLMEVVVYIKDDGKHQPLRCKPGIVSDED